jgi:hypothetical protein
MEIACLAPWFGSKRQAGSNGRSGRAPEVLLINRTTAQEGTRGD